MAIVIYNSYINNTAWPHLRSFCVNTHIVENLKQQQ